MKKFRIYYPYYFVMMSVMSISAPFALDFAPRRPYACDLAYSCLTAALIISLLPPRDEDFRSYAVTAVLIFAAECVYFLFDHKASVLLMSVLCIVAGAAAWRIRKCLCGEAGSPGRQRHVRNLVWKMTRYFSLLSVLVLAQAMISFEDIPAISVGISVAALFLYGALMYSRVFGKSSLAAAGHGLVPSASEDASAHPWNPESADSMMKSLYSKVIGVMEDEKPYLKEDFSLYELSASVFTNKTYLSKTINVMTGKNFRQFINEYRVQYSVRLMEENPLIKVNELSVMSGFHSTVTFNMAFKLNMGMTPGEYIQRQKIKALSSRECRQICPEESS